MTRTGETINELMAKILEYQDEGGYSSLMACYNMLASYKGNDPGQTPMKKSIEATIEFLIKMGRDNGPR